jgi:hypothetical protein
MFFLMFFFALQVPNIIFRPKFMKLFKYLDFCQMVYFQTKNPALWKILEGLVMEGDGMFHGHWVYFTANWYIVCMAIWYILWPFGKFFPVWVCCTKKNLATLTPTFLSYVSFFVEMKQ